MANNRMVSHYSHDYWGGLDFSLRLYNVSNTLVRAKALEQVAVDKVVWLNEMMINCFAHEHTADLCC